MSHRDIDTAMRRGTVLPHLLVDGTADDITCRPLAIGIIIEHEAVPVAIHQITTGPTQTFLKNRSRHFCFSPGQQAGWVELHHFHIPQRQTPAHRHRQPIHAFVTRGGVIFVHGGATAGRHQHGFGAYQPKFASAHVDEQYAGQRRSITRGDQPNGPMFLQSLHRPRQHLLHQAADDLNSCQITLVRGAVKCLPGESLLMQAAIRVTVKKTANLIFQLMDACDGSFAQPPRHILIRKPFTADNCVHEMTFNRITWRQCDIVTTLNHARAAAFSNQALDGDCHLGIRRRFLGMQRCKQPSAATPQNQDIGIMPFNRGVHHLDRL